MTPIHTPVLIVNFNQMQRTQVQPQYFLSQYGLVILVPTNDGRWPGDMLLGNLSNINNNGITI